MIVQVLAADQLGVLKDALRIVARGQQAQAVHIQHVGRGAQDAVFLSVRPLRGVDDLE